MTDSTTLIVAKLGGSLLAWPGLEAGLRDWLASCPEARVLLMPGGGEQVAELRREQASHHWPDEVVHWRAIEVMQSNAEQLVARFSEFGVVLDIEGGLEGEQRVSVIHPLNWARQCLKLPMSWAVTSDSIAAEFCLQVQSICLVPSSLVLLKSTGTDRPNVETDWLIEQVELGTVDEYFRGTKTKFSTFCCRNSGYACF